MNRIKYIPVDQSDFDKKNHVFFAAYPKEQDRLLDEIKRDIFETQNCAILFDSAPNEIYDEQFLKDLELLKVQLVVIPITTKLLTQKNQVVSVLLPYALENHLPVLPIMQEPGLEKLYEKAFGNLQFLDKYTVDVTTIPYKDKLKKYLEAVLINDETAAKIREAFDAYIFLSYRKKDRALANKLMKLIHEVPQLRDVAIWYDEFLVFGENFNDNIAKALSKSKLFAMAVTENLVNEDNYVRKIEYKKAKEAAMPILPAQMSETSQAQMRACFEDIPDNVDAYNGPLLKNALLDALKHIALAKKNEPQHKFLIGLAYLNGVDVEVNHERAVELIESAAEAGVPDAMEKLAEMYFNAEGVGRDFEKSLYWLRRNVLWWKKKCDETDLPADRICYGKKLHQLGAQLFERQRLPDARQAFLDAVDEFTACLQSEAVAAEAETHLLDALALLSAVLSNDSDFTGMKSTSERIIAQLTQLSADNMSCDQRDSLARAYVHLAFAEKNLGNAEAAEKSYQDALALFLYDTANERSYDENLTAAYVYLAMGDFYLSRERYAEAETSLTRTIEYALKIAKDTSRIDAWELVIKAYLLMGNLYKDSKQPAKGREMIGECLSISQSIADQTGMLAMKHHVGTCYSSLGNLEIDFERPEDEKIYRVKAVEIFEELAKETDSVGCKQSLATEYTNMGSLYCAVQAWQKGDAFYQKALEVYQSISDQTCVDRDMASVYSHWAMLFYEKDDLLKAKRCFREAKKYALKQLAEGDFPEVSALLSDVTKGLGIIYLRWKMYDSAILCLNESLKIAEKLRISAENYELMAECCDAMRCAYRGIGDGSKTAEYSIKQQKYINEAEKLRKV